MVRNLHFQLNMVGNNWWQVSITDPNRQQKMQNGQEVQKYVPIKRSSPRGRRSSMSSVPEISDDDDYEN